MRSATLLAEVVFLSPADGGRQWLAKFGSTSTYRPHLVVQDRRVREARLRDGPVVDEEYLGVSFLECPTQLQFGIPAQVLVRLDYPDVDYSGLCVGATFTVREGPKIVGHGVVLDHGDAV